MTKARYTSGGNTSDATFGYNGAGQLTSITDWYGGANTSLRYAYDDAGRLTRITDYDDATLDYVYDAAGNVVTMTDYHDSVFTYTYGNKNNLVTLSAPGGKNWVYSYNDLGQAAQVSIPNGMTTAYSYDTRNRLTKIEHKDGATVLDGFTYALDDQGNVTKTTYQDSAYWDYWYDGRNRLTKAERKDSGATLLKRYTYTYSIADNMTTKEVYTPPSTTVTTTFAYNPANELTTQTVGGTTTDFAYDAWGRLTNKDDGTYSADYYWNYGDKLTRVDSDFPDEGTATYSYGGDQKRRERDDGEVTKYRWNRGWDVLGTEDANGTIQQTVVIDAMHSGVGLGALAEIAGTNPAQGEYKYFSHDGLSSVERVRNDNKVSLGETQYAPFGEIYAESGYAPLFGYARLLREPGQNLNYAPYRFNDPTIGRWLSRDPIKALGTGNHVYNYASLNPIGMIDPLGTVARDRWVGRQMERFLDDEIRSNFVGCIVGDPANFLLFGGTIAAGVGCLLGIFASIVFVILRIAALIMAINVPDPSDILVIMAAVQSAQPEIRMIMGTAALCAASAGFAARLIERIQQCMWRRIPDIAFNVIKKHIDLNREYDRRFITQIGPRD